MAGRCGCTCSKKAEDESVQISDGDIERVYRPLFDQHGYDGIPLRIIKRELRNRTGGSPQHMERLLSEFDTDRDAKLTYEEFRNAMTKPEIRRQFTRKQKLLKVAIQNILPGGEQKDFLKSYNCRPPPVFMILLSIAQGIAFGVYAAKSASKGNPVSVNSGVSLDNPLVYKPTRRYEAWRFITYMFLHDGYLHLIGNLVVQLLVGLPLEIVHKWWRLILIYMLGVVAGSLAHSVTDMRTLLVGASGGTYALIGGHLAATILNWKEMNYKLCSGSFKRILLSAPVRLAMISVFVCIDVGLVIYRRFFSATVSNSAVTAHAGGFLAGLLLGVLILKNIRKLSWELKLGWIGLVIYLIFCIVAIFVNSFYPGYPETDWRKCCP